MSKFFGRLNSKLVYKFTTFFILAVLLPLIIILSYVAVDMGNRNIKETKSYAGTTVSDIEKAISQELDYAKNLLNAVIKNQYITEYPIKCSDETFKTEAHNLIGDFSNGNTAVFNSIKFYYFQLDYWAEDSLFLSTEHISDKKWYIDFFAEKDYENWRLGEDKNTVYIIRRLFKDGENIGVAIANVELDYLIKSISSDFSYKTKIFAFVTNAPNKLFSLNNEDSEFVSNRIFKAKFNEPSRHGSDYRTSLQGNTLLAVKSLEQYGITVGCAVETDSSDVLASSYIIIGLMVVVLLGAVGVFYFFVFRIFGKINRDMLLMEKCIENDFTTRIPVMSEDEIGQIEHQFNRMLDKVDTLKNNIIMKEQAQKHAELTALQNQTNPHFIYNTLNTFRMKLVINGDNQTAEEIAKFGKLLRYNMITRDHITTLDNEMTYLKYYLDLQNDRFAEKILYDYEIPLGFGRVKIPRFIFQPMAENALKYGKKQGAPLKITVSFDIINDEHLLVSFMDNGKGCEERMVNSLNSQFIDRRYIHRPQTEDSSKIGLKNINERLILIYGEDYHLSVSSELNQYFEVVFKIPIEK